jgi:hypothetical protein
MNHKILTLCLFVFFSRYAMMAAANIKGGSISYACLGNNKYKVTARINRECSGPGIASYQMNVLNSLASVPMSASRVSIRDGSLVCSKNSLPCSSPNQAASPGTEEHVYEATVDFNASTYATFLQNSSNNCQVYFTFETSSRDSFINTMTNGQFYIMAMLDLCLTGNSCNSSAVSQPVSTLNICCNQPFAYNPGFNDKADNDSISVDTVVPRTGKNSVVAYVQGYTGKYSLTPYCPPTSGTMDCRALPNAKPPRGIYFDKLTGDFILTPIVCDERSAIVFRAYEYRIIAGKRELVGFSEKETGFYIRQCPENNAPYFTGAANQSVCEGNKICMTIATRDEPFLPKQTVPDTVDLSWNSGIPGATFTIIDPAAREKEAQFCWQTKIGDARPAPYTFMVTAKDDVCNVPGVSSRGYSIKVKPKARSIRNYTKSQKGKMVFEAIPVSDTLTYKAQNYTYKFTIRDSSNSGTPLFMTYNRKDSFRFTSAGKYIIEHEVNNPPYNCPAIYTDTVYVTQKHLTAIPDLANQRISIVPNPGHGVLNIVSEYMDVSSVTVRIYAMDGKMVSELSAGNSTINVSGLKPGMYIFEIAGENLYQHQRVVID